MSLPKVIITDFITEPLSIERDVLGKEAELVALDAMSEKELVGQIEDATALICYHLSLIHI